MKIIHISTPKSWRGGEQQLFYLAQELKAQFIEQLVLCPAESTLSIKCQAEDIPCHTYYKSGFLKIRLAKQIKKIYKSNINCIIHTHDSHAHTAAVMAAQFFNVKCPIVISRRVDFAVSKSLFSRWKYNHKAVKKIICVSDKINEITSQAIKDKSKLITIHSGIDIQRFQNIERYNILKNKYNLPENAVLIGNTSALADHKDYFTFINAAELLLNTNKNYYFFVIGDGPLRESIKNKIIEKGLIQNIIMTGFLKNIPEILKELNVFLITSKTEGLGTSVLDAFASGVPVIATKAGGIPEIVIHEQTGLLAEVGDYKQIAELLNSILHDEAKRNILIKNAREKLLEFDKRFTAKKTLQVYKAL